MMRAALAVLATLALASPAGAKPLTSCGDHAWTAPPRGTWRHKLRSKLTVKLGAPQHALEDVLTTDGAHVALDAKLAYGVVEKDLEREDAHLWLDSCDGWLDLGPTRSDDHGRTHGDVGRELAAGVYGARVVVVGDASEAAAVVRVFPKGTHVAIFDLDGTLTESDAEIARQAAADLFAGILAGHTPTPMTGGARLTRAEAARGEVIVYLTGRPSFLSERTRAWLAAERFAPGTIILGRAPSDSIPGDQGVGDFKRRRLKALAKEGFVIDVAYGNAETDVAAYLDAGIAKDRVYIIGTHGGEQGTNAVKGDWDARAKEVEGAKQVAQP